MSGTMMTNLTSVPNSSSNRVVSYGLQRNCCFSNWQFTKLIIKNSKLHYNF